MFSDFERVEHNCDRLQIRHTGVCDDGDALGSESGDLVSDLAGYAGSELDSGGVYGEGSFEIVVGHGYSSSDGGSRSSAPTTRENFRSNVKTGSAPTRLAAARIIRS